MAVGSALSQGQDQGCAAYEDFKAGCTPDEFNALGYTNCECEDCDRDNCPAEFVVPQTYEDATAHGTYMCVTSGGDCGGLFINVFENLDEAGMALIAAADAVRAQPLGSAGGCGHNRLRARGE